MKIRQIFQLLFFSFASVLASESVHAADKTIRLIYLVPSDVNPINKEGRIEAMKMAVENNRQLWSRYEATFTTEPMVEIKSDKDTNWFRTTPDNYHGSLDEWYWFGNACNEIKSEYPEACNKHNPDEDHKYIVFLEMDARNAGAAAAFGAAIMPKEMIDGIMGGSQSDIGAIGHELGHTFGMEHENCDEQIAPKGMMCNGGNYPNVELNEYHFEYLFTPEQQGFFKEFQEPKCQLNVTHEWSDGYIGEILINNTSSEIINEWMLGLILPNGHNVDGHWLSEYEQDGIVAVFTPLPSNQTIAPNANIGFGFHVAKTNSTPAGEVELSGDVCQ